MKRSLAALAVLVLLATLAGCGEDDGEATDPSAGPADPALVQTLVLTSAGGTVAPTA